MNEQDLINSSPSDISSLSKSEWVDAVQAFRRIQRHLLPIQDALFAHAMVGDTDVMDTLLEANEQMGNILEDVTDCLDEAGVECVDEGGKIMSVAARVSAACLELVNHRTTVLTIARHVNA